MSELSGNQLRKADLITGVGLSIIGGIGLFLSATMPTFPERQVDPLTAPGIFPAFVSLTLLVLGACLLVRSWQSLRSARRVVRRIPENVTETDLEAVPESLSTHRDRRAALQPIAVVPLLVGLLLMTLTVWLVGKVDFKWLISAFCLAFSVLFVPWQGTWRERAVKLMWVLLVTVLAGLVIPTVFERLFLVRLPG